MLTGAKVVSGEVNRESRALEAEVECQHSVPEAAVTALEQLLQTHYDLRQIRLRLPSEIVVCDILSGLHYGCINLR